jgi:hypothetical protein
MENQDQSSSRRLDFNSGRWLFVAIVAVFFAVNCRSYRGFFKTDDFATLGWTPFLDWSYYLRGYLTWRFQTDNFRPVAHAYYRVMDGLVHLTYAPWVLAVQLIVVIGAALLWLVLARMRFRPLACAAGCTLFLLHPSLFDAYWKPMYVFDTTCAVFALASFLFYLHDRRVLSLIAFYTAYRCKEVAILLPLVFVLYELLLGKRRWKHLLPFFAISLCFGIQALLFSRTAPRNAYSMVFSTGSLKKTIPFYVHYALAFRWSGLLIAALVLIVRDRRGYFGFLAFWILLLPLLFLPGRLFAVYTCVPMFGLAIAVASVLDQAPRSERLIYACMLLWAAFSVVQMRRYARNEVDSSALPRSYVEQLSARLNPRTSSGTTYIYGALPAGIDRLSMQSLVNNLTHSTADVVSRDEVGPLARSDSGRALLLDWNGSARQLNAERVAAAERYYVSAGTAASADQLLEGWYGIEDGFRWMMPEATARLSRPAGEVLFQASFDVPSVILANGATPILEVFIDGESLGSRPLVEGAQTVDWYVKAGEPKTSLVRFRIAPPPRVPGDSRKLGVVMVGFGYVGPDRLPLHHQAK